jgi:hypothetical protein
MDRPTRYWLELDAQSQLVTRSAPYFLPGDRLLIETARDHLDRTDVINGQICAVHVRQADQAEYTLVRVAAKSGKILAEIHGEPTREDPGPGRSSDAASTIDYTAKPPRRVGRKTSDADRSERPQKATRPDRCVEPTPGVSPERSGGWVQLEGSHQVVGLVLLLERRSPTLP